MSICIITLYVLLVFFGGRVHVISHGFNSCDHKV